MEERQELMDKLLDNANIPALSLAWCQNGSRYAAASGTTDTSAPSSANIDTLFPASSLSKPVSAAIVLDLVAQGRWNLNKKLSEYGSFGPPELQQDPRYHMLTTQMIISQCSGLPNGDNAEEKFIETPGTKFTYSRMALDFLKQVIEKKTSKTWEELAQAFFAKAHMTSSTFKQLPASHLSGSREVARPHEADGTPRALAPIDSPEVPAGSLLTTGEDYINFLQHCFKDEFLRKNLMTGVLSTLPPVDSANAQVQWGLGMGVYSAPQKTIAFHWGNNPGANSFFAMDISTGDCVVCLSNSVNGPTVFHQAVEPIVGNMTALFQWLATYCFFKDASIPKSPEAIAQIVHSIHSLASVNGVEVTNQYKQGMKQLKNGDLNPPASAGTESENFNPSPLAITPKQP